MMRALLQRLAGAAETFAETPAAQPTRERLRAAQAALRAAEAELKQATQAGDRVRALTRAADAAREHRDAAKEAAEELYRAGPRAAPSPRLQRR